MFTAEEITILDSIDEQIWDDLQSSCSHHNLKYQEQLYAEYNFIAYLIVLFGLASCTVLVTIQWGLSKTCRFIFQIISFHWALKLIIQYKRGHTLKD